MFGEFLSMGEIAESRWTISPSRRRQGPSGDSVVLFPRHGPLVDERALASSPDNRALGVRRHRALGVLRHRNVIDRRKAAFLAVRKQTMPPISSSGSGSIWTPASAGPALPPGRPL